MPAGRLHPFSSRRRPPSGRLELAFRLVKRFVSQAKPSLAWTKLAVGCPEIVLFRKMNKGKVGARSLMHTFHHPNTICSLSVVESAAEGYLIGLLLHEFGHLGSGGGEREADRWILDNFGIRIQYLGELDLEWVDQWAIRRVLGAATPPPRRNPRQAQERRRHHRCSRPLRRPPAIPTEFLL